jgi:hypothetical protein
LGLPVLSPVDWDPQRAAVFAEGAEKPSPWLGGDKRAEAAFLGSGYMRSVVDFGQAMVKAARGTGRDPLLRGMVSARITEGVKA